MYPQRCTSTQPHGRHPVEARGEQTAFTCPGLAASELQRLEAELFGS
jgi:hypothetical protein